MKEYLYDAFISYRHLKHDKAIAIKLQKLLENYKPPQHGNYTNVNRIKKVFRDESELPTSGDLGADIKKALEQSAYLIVICSEETAKSRWCMQEIEYFKQLHHEECGNILTLLVSGDPHEVFPKALCYETRVIELDSGETVSQTVEVEPLAANVAAESTSISLRKLKTEFLRIAAPILGCSYDDLYKRHQRRFIRRFIIAATALMSFITLFSVYAFANTSMLREQATVILENQKDLKNKNQELIKNQKEIEDINTALDKKNKDLLAQIDETTKQKLIADEQRKKAEDNEAEAMENMDFANMQKNLAEFNANKALQQEGIANKNKAIAEKNLGIANEQKNNLLRSQSLFLASLSKQVLAKGDRTTAVLLALSGLPKNLAQPERPMVEEATEALRNAVYTCESTFDKDTVSIDYQSILSHPSVEGFCKGIDENSIYSYSKESIRLWDLNNGRLIDELKLNIPADISWATCFEGKNSILLELSENEQNTYDFLLIKKNGQKILLEDTYLKIKYLIEGDNNNVVLVKSNGMPVYIDYNKGVVKELKSLKDFFVQKRSENIQLTGDINKNGKLLLVTDEVNQKVYLIALSDGSICATFDADYITEMFFLSDDSIIFIGTSKNRECIEKFHNGKFELVITGDNYNEFTRLGSSDSLLFMSADDGHMKADVIDLYKNKSNSMELDISMVLRLRVSPDNRYAVITGDDANYVLDLKKLKVARKLDDVDALLAFSPDDKHFLCYNGYSNTEPAELLRTDSVESAGILSKIIGSSVYGPAFVSDKKLVIRSSGILYVINLASPKQDKYYYGDSWAKAYFADKEGATFVSNTMEGGLYEYNTDSGNQTAVIDSNAKNEDIAMSASYMDFKNQRRLIISRTDEGVVKPVYYDKKGSHLIDYGNKADYEILGSGISNDGKKVMIYGSSRLVVYSTATFQKILELSSENEEIMGAVFSPDNNKVVMCYKNRLRYVDIENGRTLKTVTVARSIGSVKGSLDKRIIVTYLTYSKGFSVYDTETGSLKYTVDTYVGNDIAISGDSGTILVPSYDYQSLYSVKTGKRLLQLPLKFPEDELINNCDLNYDGTKALMTCAHSGYILEWDIVYDTRKLMDIGENIIRGRALTKEEKKEYFISE